MKNLVLFTMALFISATMLSQRNDNQEYWNSWEYEVSNAMNGKFMEAGAKKTAMYNGNEENAMVTYRIITGDNTGTYVRIQSNKSPSDYDTDRSAEGKYWNENVSKYVDAGKGHVRWQLLKGDSYNYDSETNTPKKYVTRTIYNVKPDRIMHFRRFMHRTAKTGEQRNGDWTRLVFRVVSGGNRNMFIAAQPFDTFKRGERPEQENSFKDDYNKLFGWGTFDEDSKNFDSSFEYWGEYRETLQLVPEMSTGMMK